MMADPTQCSVANTYQYNISVDCAVRMHLDLASKQHDAKEYELFFSVFSTFRHVKHYYKSVFQDHNHE